MNAYLRWLHEEGYAEEVLRIPPLKTEKEDHHHVQSNASGCLLEVEAPSLFGTPATRAYRLDA